MIYHLTNQHLTVHISSLGAELISVKSLNHPIEYMWQADPEFWGRTSPVLFPIVGRLTDNSTLIHHQRYEIPQHGFVRDMEFSCIEQSESHLLFLVSANDETRLRYPFEFELTIRYTLQHNELLVQWQVNNPNTEIMPFSIGAHPAFSTQLHTGDQFEDYDICFDQSKQYYLWQLNNAMQLVDQAIPFQEPLQQFPLNYRYFEIDALVFPHQQINTVSLKNRHHGHGVTVDFTGFPEVALWTADGKHKRSPFLCIEPWFGYADLEQGSPELKHKAGIQQLAAGERFNTAYRMAFF
ncbi:aldose 1-epimerase family protein [Moraxellaceae bacterium AER2_44_116]|jgi:galactose mutarotase-like enzyme|nr:aldose 1-epimerase family protein [Moraxellaceae bacterium]TQC97427.1 aldose 1-epimerase family protein [Moraxellaceae bacterium AER2_44_116]